ncbi:Ionotropic receptor 175 [Blattella germanica]|nr:Ionotropic receptor 175 [Blattella germanica]
MKLVFILNIMCIKASEFPLDIMTSVTAGVLDRYNTACLYLIHSSSQSDTNVIYLKHLMGYRYVQFAMTSIPALLKRSNSDRCQANRPFYVIFNATDETRTYLKEISESALYPMGRWLMFLPSVISTDNFFTDLNIPYDCEFIVVQQLNNSEDQQILLTELFRFSPNLPLQKHVVASWSKKKFTWTQTSLLKRRGNLQDVTLRAAISQEVYYDFEEEFDPASSCQQQFTYFCVITYEIWNMIETLTNATVKYVMYEDGNFSYTIGDTTWEDGIAYVLSGRADMALDSYGMTQDRIPYVSYISNLFPGKITTFVKKYGTESSLWWRILQPFSPGFWWTTLSALIILTLLMSNTWHLNVRLGISHALENFGFKDSWVFVIGIFCQQGHDSTPSALSCRLVYLTAYFTCIIIFASYSAILFSILAVQHYSPPFTDFHSLLTAGFRLGTLAGNLYVGIFGKSSDPAMRKIYDLFLKPNLHSLPKTDEEGFIRLCKEDKYAFMSGGYNLYEDKPCEILEVSRASVDMPASYIIGKYNPYYRLLTHQIEHLRRTGLLEKVLNADEDFTSDTKLQDTQASVADVLPIFCILLVGSIASIFCLAAEILISRYKPKKKQSRFHARDFAKPNAVHCKPHRGCPKPRKPDKTSSLFVRFGTNKQDNGVFYGNDSVRQRTRTFQDAWLK